MAQRKQQEIKPYSPVEAELAAQSPERVRDEIGRINKYLARGRRTIQLSSIDEGLADLIVTAYRETWRRVSLMWIRKQRFIVLTK